MPSAPERRPFSARLANSLTRLELRAPRSACSATTAPLESDYPLTAKLATVMFDIALNREQDGHLLVFKRRVD
jgi:hypothetical protein